MTKNRLKTPKSSLWSAVVAALVLMTGLVAGIYGMRQHQAEVLVSESDRFKQQTLYTNALSSAIFAASMNPFNGYADYLRATNEIILQRYGAASESLQRARAVMPHLPNLLRLAAQVEYSRNNFTSASEYLREYAAMDPRPLRTPEFVVYQYAQALYRAGMNAEAAVEFIEACQYQDHLEALLASRAVNSVLLNQSGPAIYALSRLHREFRGKVPDSAEMLSTALGAMRLDALIKFVETARPMIGEQSPLYKTLSLAYARVGREGEALRLLQRMTTYDSKDPEIWLLLGDICARLGYEDAAKTYYEEHLRLAPDSAFGAQLREKYNISGAAVSGTTIRPDGADNSR